MTKIYCICSYLAITFIFNAVVAQGWIDGHATFYGDTAGGETEYGACGYDVFHEGYGLTTTALSTALFENGTKCGTCYELKCFNSTWCKPGTIQVTATNWCPPSTPGPQAWCNPPRHHFDLSQPMFLKIGEYKAGIVPVQYRRIPCVRKGGVGFHIHGNKWCPLVVVYNVAGAGDIKAMKFKGSKSNKWVQMSRNWGMNWQASGDLIGQGISFHLTASDGKTLQIDNAVPSNWKFDQWFQGKSNFK